MLKTPKNVDGKEAASILAMMDRIQAEDQKAIDEAVEKAQAAWFAYLEQLDKSKEWARKAIEAGAGNDAHALAQVKFYKTAAENNWKIRCMWRDIEGDLRKEW